MPDLSEPFIETLKAHRLEGLDLGREQMHPMYQGGSLLNLPGSICQWMGIPAFGAEPFTPEIFAALGNPGRPARRIVWVLADALGLLSLKRWLDSSPGLVWNRLIPDSALLALTSIVPSTTTAALLTLWTGASPAAHGVVGYELWLKEYGVLADMISHRPAEFSFQAGQPGSLAAAGFNPRTFLGLPTLGMHLKTHGIEPYALQPAGIVRSGLSEMFFPEVNVLPYTSTVEMWSNLHQLLEARAPERLMAYVYWPQIDTLSHKYGPLDRRTQSDFEEMSHTFERYFLTGLSAEAREDTLLILTADHGQYPITSSPHYELRNHPNLDRRLLMRPTGESRLAYLYIHPGQTEAVREYIDRTWPNQFALVAPDYAVAAGLFGPGEPHPRLMDRLGDLIAVSRGPAYLWGPGRDDPMSGRHGGLTTEEMLVPLLGYWM